MWGPVPASWRPYLLSMLRVVAAFLFIVHGTQKLFDFPAAAQAMTFPLTSLLGVAGMIELAGGGLMLLGLLTRPVAFLVSGEMAYAYFHAHAPGGFWPINNHGELAVLFCFIWLYIAAAGPGPWSVDAMIHRAARKP